jgi:hypothetical protein
MERPRCLCRGGCANRLSNPQALDTRASTTQSNSLPETLEDGSLLPICVPALSQAILSEVLGRRPGDNDLSAVSEAQGQGPWTLALASRLGHLEFLSAFALELDS